MAQQPRPFTLLIVDDSPEDRAAFRRYLTPDIPRAGAIEETELGADALERLLHRADVPLPDCVLLDFNLPDMTGVEFLEELSGAGDAAPDAAPNGPPCAVVMLTGSGDESAAVAAMKAGAQDYLVKGSLTADALRRAVRNACEKFSLQRRLRDSETRLRQATAAAGVGTWEYDPETGEVLWDARCAELLCFPDDAARTFAEFLQRVHEDDRAEVERAVAASLDPQGDGVYTVEYRVACEPGDADVGGDGATRWVEAGGQARFDRTRTRAERMAGTLVDVTDRKRAEAARALQAAHQAHIAETLQRALLILPPSGAFPGLDVNVQYEPALDEALLGGDFADVFALSGERVALVVGDVTGKGLAAAAYTAEIKFALRMALRETGDPAAAMFRLNNHLVENQRLSNLAPSNTFVSLVAAVVDPATGSVECCAAGAEPPLILRRDAQSLPEEASVPGPLAGVEEGMPFESASTRLEPGDLLILATDGIAEARALSGGSSFFGAEGLVAAARSAGAGNATVTAEDVGAEVLARAKAFTGGRLRDDVCLLVARRY